MGDEYDEYEYEYVYVFQLLIMHHPRRKLASVLPQDEEIPRQLLHFKTALNLLEDMISPRNFLQMLQREGNKQQTTLHRHCSCLPPESS